MAGDAPKLKIGESRTFEKSELESPSLDAFKGLSGVLDSLSSLKVCSEAFVGGLGSNDTVWNTSSRPRSSASSLEVGLGTRNTLVGPMSAVSHAVFEAKEWSDPDLSRNARSLCNGHMGLRLY